MIEFRNEERAQQTIASLEKLAMCDLSEFIEVSFTDCSDCDLALVNLERWLASTSNPAMFLAHLSTYPKQARLLVMILGASQHLADSLVQNPELAYLLFDFEEFSRIPTVRSVREEGERLLAASTSYSHSLDRLRFLKQRWTLPIVVNDLAGSWDEESTWIALSSLADAIVGLCQGVAWKEYCLRKEVTELPQVMVVAFGKLGGSELNFSSDVDLVYVCEDNLDEIADKHLTRASELYNRALSDRMGRGSLYRVDLRLRPFGGAGSLVRSMRSIESYYRSYAEVWEAQALIRSRPIIGPPDLCERWEALRQNVCFRPRVSERLVDEIVAMRSRIEEYANPNDLKRGAGGIRDIEFTTQIMQLVYGSRHEALRVAPTCAVLRALSQEGLLPAGITEQLVQAYRFLRQLEHRCQLVGDVQTHSLPESDLARTNLARTMGFQEWSQLESRLESIRMQVRDIYDEGVSSAPAAGNPRDEVLALLGDFSKDVQQWFDPLPESDAFYSSLKENQGSLDRVRMVLENAPVLVPRFKNSLVQTEKLVSGEIEEEIDATSRINRLSPQSTTEALAETLSSLWLTVATQWTLSPSFDVGHALSEILEAGLKQVWQRSGGGFDVIALGSFAQRDLSFGSDADLLFLVESSEAHPNAEQAAQRFVAEIDRLKQFGAPVSVDLRLRPEGRKGLLVRTYEGLKSYEIESMDMWERFALGQPRLVCGSDEALQLTLKCAYANPLVPETLQNLLAMKTRIETERVRPEHFKRHLKLGYGGLSDIDWMVHLTEMRYSLNQSSGTSADLSTRIERLVSDAHLSPESAQTILEARERLMNYRNWVYLLGFEADIVPENPDKLGKLANCAGLSGANAFLQAFVTTIEAVRSIYLHTVERL